MDRRRFLLTSAVLLGAPSAAWAAPKVATPPRVRLVDARTGAVFDGVYRATKGPVARASDELDLFLRDWHSGGMTNIDLALLDFLTAVMAATGQKSAIVLSAYRSLDTNARLAGTQFGVADNSQHLYGRALDVHFPEKLAEAVVAARAMKRGGVGWYPRSGFVHLDTGPVRNWDLGAEGLRELLNMPPPKLPDPSGKGSPARVEASAQMTIGGKQETLLLPGRPVPANHGRVAGLLNPPANASQLAQVPTPKK